MRTVELRGQPHQSRPFTLIELLVVIGIIMILAAMLVPAFQQARAQARKTKCVSQLKQFGAAVLSYRGDCDSAPPLWLSSLHPDYISAEALYVCPQDPSQGYDGGRHGAGWPENQPARGDGLTTPDGNPDQYTLIDPSCVDRYFETDDTARNQARRSTTGANLQIESCSYMYEFANTECSWWTGDTWWNRKQEQMRMGYGRDQANFLQAGDPWQPHLFPAARCFQHWKVIWGKQELVLNVAWTGDFFYSRLTWEEGVY